MSLGEGECPAYQLFETFLCQGIILDCQRILRLAYIGYPIWRVGQQEIRLLPIHQPPDVLRTGRVTAEQAVPTEPEEVAALDASLDLDRRLVVVLARLLAGVEDLAELLIIKPGLVEVEVEDLEVI